MSAGQKHSVVSAETTAATARLPESALGRVARAIEEVGAPAAADACDAPRQIGSYVLHEVIGSGGMGVVYRAEQDYPIRRIVALKLIKPGMDSRDVIARFQSERQALAMMNHRNVARVIDAGTSEDGRPYFVMEHVPGKSITQYCDEHHYTIKQRLQLFIQACEAVQHAHQKAIIHRDIKPSNVLVTGENGDAEVKVIDFGVAKALSPTLDQQQTLYTQSGQLIGTPEYMSPEQAGSDGHAVDTRSDIYSLGVVLYELLTGALPFDPKTLRSSGVAEIQRIIREVDPPRPSTRLSTLGEGASEIASKRGTVISTLHRELRGELEWIPLKAMRKEPDRRYTSAQEFAEDIRNYLDSKPLFAGPESRIYRTRKLLVRHRAGVSASAAMVLLLTAGIAFYIHRINAEQARTLEALRDAELARGNTQAVNEFLIRDLLGAARPASTRGRTLSIDEVVERAALSVGERFGDRPAQEVEVRLALSSIYWAIGRTDPSLAQAESALQRARAEFGDEHQLTLSAMDNLAVRLTHSRYAEAERLARDLLEKSRRLLGEDHPFALNALHVLGYVLLELGDPVGAEHCRKDAVERRRRVLGDDHLDTLSSIVNLGALYREQGRLADAEPLLREAVERTRKVVDEEHPVTLMYKNQLGMLLAKQQRYEEAEAIFREGVRVRLEVLGIQHPYTRVSIRELAKLCAATGRHEEAARLWAELPTTQPTTRPAAGGGRLDQK